MSYDRDRIEKLVPGIWDEWRVLDAPNEHAADPDMPKSPSKDPRRASDGVTELADIQRAWSLAGMTEAQRKAVLLVHGLDYSTREAGRLLGWSHTSVAAYALAGIEALGEFLNGQPYALQAAA